MPRDSLRGTPCVNCDALVLYLETHVSNTIQVSRLMLLFPEIAHKADYEGIWGLLSGVGLKHSLQVPPLNTFL